MSVRLSPAFSVIVRIAELERCEMLSRVERGELGEVFDRDHALIVLGPLFEPPASMDALEASGLAYYDSYFDLPHSGGTVPDWCAVSLEMRSSAPIDRVE